MSSGKYVIIGATSALAEAVCRILAARGASLYLVARKAEALEILAADLRTRGATGVHTLIADLLEVSRHDEIVRASDQALGGSTCVLICHGTFSDQALCQRDYIAAELEIRTDFLSVVSLLTRFAALLEPRRAGSIAVIGSVAGDRGRQSNYVYGSAKAGLAAYLEGLRNRLYHSGVNVLTIKPGMVDTPMTAGIRKTLLFAQPPGVARDIVRAIDRRKSVLYTPGYWRWIMLAIRWTPEFIFKRLRL